MKKNAVIFLTFLVLQACTTQQINSTLDVLGSTVGGTEGAETSSSILDTDTIAKGLKQALVKGAANSALQASTLDGFLGNAEIRIPFPPQIENVKTRLTSLGLGSVVTKFEESINRGAEKAAEEAKPIFVAAISKMTIADAWNILKGDSDAATQYLRKATSDELTTKFRPIIDNSLSTVGATKYYTDLSSRYNQIPFVKPIETDLGSYVNSKALDGLFTLIAKEELKIRENPLERTTDLLKRVFAQQ